MQPWYSLDSFPVISWVLERADLIFLINFKYFINAVEIIEIIFLLLEVLYF